MDKLLKQAKDAFKDANEWRNSNAERWEEDYRFARLGEQWDDDIKKIREEEKRPLWTYNLMPSFIRQVTNDARQNKPQIKVFPVDDSSDPDTAQILNGLLRSIQVASNADAAYDTAIDFAASMGVGYFRVDLDYARNDTFDLDIKINRILNPMSVVQDPFSTAVDSSDWNSCFVVDTMTKEQFETEYPDAKAVDWDTLDGSSETDELWFVDEKVVVAEWWTREEVPRKLYKMSDGSVIDQETLDAQQDMFLIEGISIVDQRVALGYKVMQHKLTGVEILESKEWPGQYIPVVPVYGEEVAWNGDRQFLSLIHFSKDAQRAYNAAETHKTEMLALAPKVPFIGPAGAFDADDNWSRANQANLPYLEYDAEAVARAGGMPPQRQQNMDISPGAIQLTMDANENMKRIMGIHDAGLGAPSNEISGRAILYRQREGDTSTFHFPDNLNRAIQHTGKIIVDLIPKIYTRERMVRILGEDGSPTNVPVNQPVIEQEEGDEVSYLPVTEEQTPLGVVYKTTYNLELVPDGVIPKVFDLTAGKYDVVVQSGPSYTTKRQESADQMMQLVSSFPQAAPLLGDILAKNLDWPEADEIKRRLQTLLPPEIRGKGDPKVQQLELALEALKQELQAANDDRAERVAKVQVELEKVKTEQEEARIKAYDAETKRMKVQAEIGTGEEDMASFETRQMEMAHEAQQRELDRELEREKMLFAAATPEAMAHSQAIASMKYTGRSPEQNAAESMSAQSNQFLADALAQMAASQAQLAQAVERLSAPKRVIRDENGEPIGVETVDVYGPPQE
jgi:hypothetical protein